MPRLSTTARGYGPVHAATSRRLRAEHVERFGWWCPGLDSVPVHPSTDLTADHLVPGDSSRGYQVLCRSCNVRRMMGWR